MTIGGGTPSIPAGVPPDKLTFIYLAFNIVLAVFAQMVLKTVSTRLSSVRIDLRAPFAALTTVLGSPMIHVIVPEEYRVALVEF